MMGFLKRLKMKTKMRIMLLMCGVLARGAFGQITDFYFYERNQARVRRPMRFFLRLLRLGIGRV